MKWPNNSGHVKEIHLYCYQLLQTSGQFVFNILHAVFLD